VTFGSGSKLADKTSKPVVRKPLASTGSLDWRELRIYSGCKHQHGPCRLSVPGSPDFSATMPLDVDSVDRPTPSDALRRKLPRGEQLSHTPRTDFQLVGHAGDIQEGHI